MSFGGGDAVQPECRDAKRADRTMCAASFVLAWIGIFSAAACVRAADADRDAFRQYLLGVLETDQVANQPFVEEPVAIAAGPVDRSAPFWDGSPLGGGAVPCGGVCDCCGRSCMGHGCGSGPRVMGWWHECLFGAHVKRLTYPWRRAHPDDPLRHRGIGHPLIGTSWLNRPYHVGWFLGSIIPEPPIRGLVDVDDSAFGGYRIGHDFDHYWGVEGRFGISRPRTVDFSTGTMIDDNIFIFWDTSLLYYPWGDALWRPYISLGLGVAHSRFEDLAGTAYAEVQLNTPLGFGVKYQLRRWLAVRFDALDNIAWSGSGLDTQHNFLLTLGVEVRFGAEPVSYWPWNPGMQAM